MKNNSTATILNVLLGLCLVAAVVLCVQYIFLSREARTLNIQINSITAYNNSARSLVADCLKYGESNPAIYPILQTVGVPKPAGK